MSGKGGKGKSGGQSCANSSSTCILADLMHDSGLLLAGKVAADASRVQSTRSAKAGLQVRSFAFVLITPLPSAFPSRLLL